MSDPYSGTGGGGGKLKLKGVAGGKVDKKRKKKSRPDGPSGNGEAAGSTEFRDNSVVLKDLPTEDAQESLAEEDAQLTKASNREVSLVGTQLVEPGSGTSGKEATHLKTEAERRHEEQRRKRLEDRLKKEGVKTHKQRVEELNRYLSGLSEHHDMPKIGPG